MSFRQGLVGGMIAAFLLIAIHGIVVAITDNPDFNEVKIYQADE